MKSIKAAAEEWSINHDIHNPNAEKDFQAGSRYREELILKLLRSKEAGDKWWSPKAKGTWLEKKLKEIDEAELRKVDQ